MNKLQGKSRILGLIIRRNQIEKINLLISLNSIRVEASKLEVSIDVNVREYQELLQIVTGMMGSNKLLDPLLWQERMQYAQELQNLNKALNDKVSALHLEIRDHEKKVEVLTTKEKSLERKMMSLNNEFGLERIKMEEIVLLDLYAVHSAGGL